MERCAPEICSTFGSGASARLPTKNGRSGGHSRRPGHASAVEDSQGRPIGGVNACGSICQPDGQGGEKCWSAFIRGGQPCQDQDGSRHAPGFDWYGHGNKVSWCYGDGQTPGAIYWAWFGVVGEKKPTMSSATQGDLIYMQLDNNDQRWNVVCRTLAARRATARRCGGTSCTNSSEKGAKAFRGAPHKAHIPARYTRSCVRHLSYLCWLSRPQRS